jgi:hypothetical protein
MKLEGSASGWFKVLLSAILGNWLVGLAAFFAQVSLSNMLYSSLSLSLSQQMMLFCTLHATLHTVRSADSFFFFFFLFPPSSSCCGNYSP